MGVTFMVFYKNHEIFPTRMQVESSVAAQFLL